MALYKLVFNFN